MKVFLGITGASGTRLGLLLAQALQEKCELYCVLSDGAKLSLCHENLEFKPFLQGDLSKSYELEEKLKLSFKLTNTCFLKDSDLGAGPASGSFKVEKSIIAPCSLNTLGKVSSLIANSLITRACAVALKEKKQLVLGLRESPLSTLALQKAYELSLQGVFIAPPMLAEYAGTTFEQVCAYVVGKWMDILGFEYEDFKRWEGI